MLIEAPHLLFVGRDLFLGGPLDLSRRGRGCDNELGAGTGRAARARGGDGVSGRLRRPHCRRTLRGDAAHRGLQSDGCGLRRRPRQRDLLARLSGSRRGAQSDLRVRWRRQLGRGNGLFAVGHRRKRDQTEQDRSAKRMETHRTSLLVYWSIQDKRQAPNVPPPPHWSQKDRGIARRRKLILGTELERAVRVQEDLFVGAPMERRREFAAANLQAESYVERKHNARWAALGVAHARNGITANVLTLLLPRSVLT